LERKEKRQAAIRELKEEVILNGAKDAFSRLGFHKTRLEDIAASAGFSKTALYYYYESKEEIFLDLMIRESRDILNNINSSIRSAATMFDGLTRYIRALLEGIGEEFSLISSMMDFEAEAVPDSKLFHKHREKLLRIHEYSAEYEKITCTLLQTGRKNGEFSLPLDDMLLAGYINALLHGVMQRWCRQKKMNDIETEIVNLMEFIKPALTGNKK
jgi:AcrR family transcriptional regulator